MAPDPSVVAALESALAADPSNQAVRVHLAGLFLQSGAPELALGHLQLVLGAQPDHLEALSLAARAAALLGDTARAQAWQRLHDALAPPGATPADGPTQGTAPVLGGQPAPPAPQSPPPLLPPGPLAPPTPLGAPEPLAPPGPLAPPEPPGPLARPEPPGRPAEHGPAVPALPDGSGDDDAGPDWDAELLQLVGLDRAGRVTLADVAGLDVVKQRLEASFLGPMRNPELRQMYGATMRGGLLLWGPPGCGKTFLARAVAGELGAHFASVGLHDVLDMWLGSSEKKLHELFEMARRRKPSVLFFDEIDAIGHARVNLNRSAGRNVVAQLLTELDGVDESNDGIFIIGATNQPWDVDPALRRPGRLDRSLLVLPPDAPAREAILRYHLRDRPVAVGSLGGVVVATADFSGADLRLVCEEAAQTAMADAMRTGVARPIGLPDLMAAARSLRSSTTPWLEMARNYATYSNLAGEYDELVEYLRSQGKGRR